MRFHHVCLIVSNLERAIGMWTTLFDFKLDQQFVAPDAAMASAPDSTFLQLLEDIWGIKGARTNVALLSSPGGALLELQEPITPSVQLLPKNFMTYNSTGIREICFHVQDIDNWFEKVKAHGYRLQTDYVWPVNNQSRTFMFHDDDGHLIQLWESPDATAW